MSRNNMRHVIRRENSAQNTINLRRPMSGSKKRPTCTVPAEHSQARQAAEDNCNGINQHWMISKAIQLQYDYNLPPIVFLRSPWAFLNVADHSVGLHPMAVAFGRYAVCNWRANPTTCTYPVAIPRIMIALRPCCQLFQNPVHRPADSRPAPVHVSRPVVVLSRPFHIDQIQTVYNVGFVAFPAAGVVPHHRILCERIFIGWKCFAIIFSRAAAQSLFCWNCWGPLFIALCVVVFWYWVR